MRARDLKGKKFHFSGEDESGAPTLAECSDKGSGVIVTLKKPASGVPLKLGEELCQVRADDKGHFEIESLLDSDDSNSSGGPSMVATDEYRSGWDQTFGSRSVN